MSKKKIVIFGLISIVTAAIITGCTNKKKTNVISNLNISEINDRYRDKLCITGEFECKNNMVEYKERWGTDRWQLYRKIAFVRVFSNEPSISYDQIDDLLDEYDTFCNSGKESELINNFCKAYDLAVSEAKKEVLCNDDVASIIYEFALGNYQIVNGELVHEKKAEPGMYKFDEITMKSACETYEKYHEIANKWYFENYIK